MEEGKRKFNMAVIGFAEDVLPFTCTGADVYITQNVYEASEALHRIIDENFKIIFISDDLLKEMGDILDKYSSDPVPIISALPGSDGESSFFNRRLKVNVKNAIGIDPSGLKKNE